MGIAENIKFLRKKAGLTQKQLADKTNLSIATIQGYEQGKYEPKTDTLYKLRKALDCNINEILDKPFDLYEGIYIDIKNLDELPQKYKELTGKDLKPDYKNYPIDFEIDRDQGFKHAWNNLLLMNNIHFMSYTKHTGERGLLFSINDDKYSYFLTTDQCQKLPQMAIEQIKTLIKAMADKPFNPEENREYRKDTE